MSINKNYDRKNYDRTNYDRKNYDRNDYDRNDYDNENNENNDIDELIPTDNVQLYDSFETMNLQESLLKGIYSYGYEKPSIIQQQAIQVINSGKDIIGQAQSGTGKTGTFSIGTLNNINTSLNRCQALFLSPTRELAIQTNNVVENLGYYMNLKTHLCIGGTAINNDIDSIKGGVHIIIGTPGRILDMINRTIIDITYIKIFILDEADEILSRGFINQIYDIFISLPKQIQIGIFSATMSNDIIEITNKFMKNPVKILLENKEVTLEGIQQFYIDVENNYKFDILFDLYSIISVTQTIIYCNSRNMVNNLQDKFKQNNFPVTSIHSEMNIQERKQVLNEFKNGKYRILITTDLLARGIDIQQISLIINYDIPKDKENYIHRIGRSGRFGRKGLAINFVSKNDKYMIQKIQDYYKTVIDELPVNFDELL